ncbi:hypothetical protein ES288_A08G125100v1 [Gossypium darwinii]|uniref:Uncharacterized protein n=1 Tax=Gossypium darwinii TaxID=34276 RepID=A0A5D2FJW5_GOSDA|nr:hypothetical protein ES288_A08G125100v1 [Gossypium darwinii]
MKGSGPFVATVLVASTVALTSSSSAEVQHVSFSPTSSNQELRRKEDAIARGDRDSVQQFSLLLEQVLTKIKIKVLH